MHKQVKKCLDNHDIKGLRYIFIDSLDVDPTFEDYRDDYRNCLKESGFFEEYQELTPVHERSCWNNDYWQKLKRDLEKNFSQKRFEHMIEVAGVVYADKVSRLNKERNARLDVHNSDAPVASPEKEDEKQIIASKDEPVEVVAKHSTRSEIQQRNANVERLKKEEDEQIRKEREDWAEKNRLEQQSRMASKDRVEAGTHVAHNDFSSNSNYANSTYNHAQQEKKTTNGCLGLGLAVVGVVVLVAAIVILGRE